MRYSNKRKVCESRKRYQEMENLPSNNRKLNKPSKHRASSFRGEFQRFYGRLHDCERIDTTHDGHISEDVEEDSPTELTRNTVMPVVSSDYISTSPLSSRQNTSIFRSASTSVKTPDRKLRRLKSSRSAVTFKEMKKTLKKSDSLYHSHLSEVQAPFPRLESDSVIQKDSEQSLDYRNNATKDSVRPDFTPLDDLLVDLPDDQVSGKFLFQNVVKKEQTLIGSYEHETLLSYTSALRRSVKRVCGLRSPSPRHCSCRSGGEPFATLCPRVAERRKRKGDSFFKGHFQHSMYSHTTNIAL